MPKPNPFAKPPAETEVEDVTEIEMPITVGGREYTLRVHLSPMQPSNTEVEPAGAAAPPDAADSSPADTSGKPPKRDLSDFVDDDDE